MRRRRLWRWAVVVWAVAVTVAGGATLWLQDSRPPGEDGKTYRWREFEPRPTHDSDCPGPGKTPTPRPDGTVVDCAYAYSTVEP